MSNEILELWFLEFLAKQDPLQYNSVLKMNYKLAVKGLLNLLD